MKKLLPAVLIIFALAMTPFIFRVRQVELNDNNCVNQQGLPYKGRIIFTLKKSVVEKDLKEKFLCISKVELVKIHPSKVKFNILVENAVAKIAGTELLVTEGGKVSEGNAQNLPLLFLPSNIAVSPHGNLDDKLALYGAKLASTLAKSDFHATNIRILSGTEIAVYGVEDMVAIFSWEKLPEVQVDSLQQVIALAKIGEQKIAKIDLRFEKPVITFK